MTAYRLFITGLACASLPFIGCSAGEERVQEDFEAFVDERNSCEKHADCMVGSYGCPLGCEVAFNRAHEEQVADEAERLIKKYERGGRSCDYGCPGLGEAICDEGTCVVDEVKSEGCTSPSTSLLDIRVPQVVVDGECPLNMYVASELDFETVVATFECSAAGDSCLCLLETVDSPLDESHWILASQGDRRWGMVSPFLHEDPCGEIAYGEFVATLEDFQSSAFLTHEGSNLKQSAFAAADRTGCTEDGHCLPMPIGAKACGGPSAHIVYSSETTDEDALSQRAEEATVAERAFNQENGISSDCALVTPPTLACQDSICVRVDEE